MYPSNIPLEQIEKVAPESAATNNEPKKSINVVSYPGITVFGSLPGQLNINDQGAITLTVADGTPEAPIYKNIFSNLTPANVKKVSMTLDFLRIKTNDKMYRMSVSEFANIAVAVGGVAGIAAAQSAYKNSNAELFLKELEARGFKVKRFGYGMMWLTALAVSIALIGIIVLVLMLGDF